MLVSKKGNLMKEILSCGLGYHHIKKVNMANYCRRPNVYGDMQDGTSLLPDFEVCTLYRQTDRQTDKQTDRQMDRLTL